MNIFLIQANIEEHRYMEDIPEKYNDIRIVMAHNESEAVEKYLTFWEKKDVDYGVSYYAHILNCDEAIQ